MTMAIRMILTLAMVFTLAGEALAQQTTSDTTATTGTRRASEETASVPPRPSYETRQDFNTLLRQHPPELATILTLDPPLLSNEAFLAGYPELARFVAQHPEVRRSPKFYLADFEPPRDRPSMLADFLQGLVVALTFLFVLLALGWFIRTLVEQKRWTRLSQTQSEVHNKILDRFGSSEELLQYVRSPAGTKFLESAPIPLHAGPAMQNAPLNRILWSIQLGVVVVAGALGLLFVSGRFDKETAQGMFAMGAIGFAVGAGFIASAIVSFVISRRLGLWQGQDNGADDPGVVRRSEG
jgi:hypothetical protein